MSVSRAIHGSYEFDRIVYQGSHALRTKNIHRVLRFGALFSIACLSLEPFTGRMSLLLACKCVCSSPIVRLVNHCFTTRTGRTGRTGCTVLVEVLSYNDIQVIIVPRPAPSVIHCFTTCTGRTSRVKPSRDVSVRQYWTRMNKYGERRVHVSKYFHVF